MEEKTKNIFQKLLEAQREIGAIKKDTKNDFYKSNYFDINALLAEVKPVMNKLGLVILQAINIQDNKPVLITNIFDSENPKEVISSVALLPEGLDAQKTGSAITYFRRYSLQSLLALEAEDDDGNVASIKTNTKVVNKNNDDVPF